MKSFNMHRIPYLAHNSKGLTKPEPTKVLSMGELFYKEAEYTLNEASPETVTTPSKCFEITTTYSDVIVTGVQNSKKCLTSCNYDVKGESLITGWVNMLQPNF